MAIHCDKCGTELQRNHANDLQQASIRIGDLGVVRTGDWCRRCVDQIKEAILEATQRDAQPARKERGE